MPLTEKELQQIREEAEREYPFPKKEDNFRALAYRRAQQEAYIAAVTKERERAKVLIEGLPSVESVDRLARSINAADPNGYDVIIKDLKKQVDKISKQYKNALNQYTNE